MQGVVGGARCRNLLLLQLLKAINDIISENIFSRDFRFNLYSRKMSIFGIKTSDVNYTGGLL